MTPLWGTSTRRISDSAAPLWFATGMIAGMVLSWIIDAIRFVQHGGLR
jgi:hypothetical protein